MLRTFKKKYISNLVVMLTAGHGGMLAGEYTTSEKDWKRHQFDDGSLIYEGEFNRTLKALVMHFLHEFGVKYLDIVPEQTDVPRKVRCQRINDAYKTYPLAIHLDLHANAFGEEDKGTGCEVWVGMKPSNNSLSLAKCLEKEYKDFMDSGNRVGLKLPFRGIKNKDFDMVAMTDTPSVIVECPFMTTEKECKAYLINLEGRIELAKWIAYSILEYIDVNGLKN